MIEIRADSYWFSISQNTEYDSSMNNHLGGNKLVVTINANQSLYSMEEKIRKMEETIKNFVEREEQEAKMREDWPALQDVYSQYLMVREMLKNAKKTKGEDNA